MALWDGTGAYLAQTGGDGLRVTPLQKLPAAQELHAAPWIDSRGRLWLPHSADSAAVLDHDRPDAEPGEPAHRGDAERQHHERDETDRANVSDRG